MAEIETCNKITLRFVFAGELNGNKGFPEMGITPETSLVKMLEVVTEGLDYPLTQAFIEQGTRSPFVVRGVVPADQLRGSNPSDLNAYKDDINRQLSGLLLFDEPVLPVQSIDFVQP